MAAFPTASLVLALLLFILSVSADQRIIRAEPGENATLPCRADKTKEVIVAQWRRTNQTVCFYRESDFEGKNNECNNSRADLLDVKNGDVSLVLKKVTTDDTGRYECRVDYTKNNRRKRSVQDTDPIISIDLKVEPGNNDGVNRTGLIVGLSVFAVVALLVLVLYKRSRGSSQKSKRPPADFEATLKELDE